MFHISNRCEGVSDEPCRLYLDPRISLPPKSASSLPSNLTHKYACICKHIHVHNPTPLCVNFEKYYLKVYSKYKDKMSRLIKLYILNICGLLHVNYTSM